METKSKMKPFRIIKLIVLGMTCLSLIFIGLEYLEISGLDSGQMITMALMFLVLGFISNSYKGWILLGASLQIIIIIISESGPEIVNPPIPLKLSFTAVALIIYFIMARHDKKGWF